MVAWEAQSGGGGGAGEGRGPPCFLPFHTPRNNPVGASPGVSISFKGTTLQIQQALWGPRLTTRDSPAGPLPGGRSSSL